MSFWKQTVLVHLIQSPEDVRAHHEKLWLTNGSKHPCSELRRWSRSVPSTRHSPYQSVMKHSSDAVPHDELTPTAVAGE